MADMYARWGEVTPEDSLVWVTREVGALMDYLTEELCGVYAGDVEMVDPEDLPDHLAMVFDTLVWVRQCLDREAERHGLARRAVYSNGRPVEVVEYQECCDPKGVRYKVPVSRTVHPAGERTGV